MAIEIYNGLDEHNRNKHLNPSHHRALLSSETQAPIIQESFGITLSLQLGQHNNNRSAVLI